MAKFWEKLFPKKPEPKEDTIARIHRVVDKWYDGAWFFRTKGDANPIIDDAPVPESRILGVLVGRIPYIGWVKILLTDSGLLIPLLVIVSALLIIFLLKITRSPMKFLCRKITRLQKYLMK